MSPSAADVDDLPIANGDVFHPVAEVPAPKQQELLGDRVKQTLAMLFALWTLIVAPFCMISILLLFGFYTLLWPFAGLYMVWYVYDFKTPCRGSRFSAAVHDWPLWKHMVNYFPIEVHKTAELPPDRNYVISAHPHGVLGSSSMILFSSGGLNMRTLFPGIRIHGATLLLNFLFPIRREFFMALGIISCSPESIEYILGHPVKGNAVGIVPGGASEALEAFPGKHRLILANRKGFIRLAIKHGASLVPVYHFGETNLYDQLPNPRGSQVRRFQEFMKGITGVSIPFAMGQNMLTSILPNELAHRLPKWMTIGILPFRHKVVTVVGAPIDVKKETEPSRELIDAVHAEYCAKLRALFNEHKVPLGGLPESAELEFL